LPVSDLVGEQHPSFRCAMVACCAAAGWLCAGLCAKSEDSLFRGTPIIGASDNFFEYLNHEPSLFSITNCLISVPADTVRHLPDGKDDTGKVGGGQRLTTAAAAIRRCIDACPLGTAKGLLMDEQTGSLGTNRHRPVMMLRSCENRSVPVP
jgi:hypothetical protein